MKKGRRKKNRSFFNPDKIATAISQNLNRDLGSASQLYGGSNTLQDFVRRNQKGGTLKKYVPFGSDTSALEQEAFTGFLATNMRMGKVNAEFQPPRDLPRKHLTDRELMLVRARALMHWVLGPFLWGEFFDDVSHSGGVTVGVSFSDTSIEKKFTFPLSTTVDAAFIFMEFLSESSLLKDALVKHNHRLPDSPEWFHFVEGSRATTVDKTVEKRRMIAVEPTVNMYLQQGLMAMMYRRMRGVIPSTPSSLSSGLLDVTSLPFEHQDLAWRGSVSGSYATIDFSSASDCVSIELLRWLLPPEWFDVVDRVRSPAMKVNGEFVNLNMIATMGNAGTFPLETLVFWTIGVATVMSSTRSNPNHILSLPEERSAVSVFGDDCILPTEHAESFMDNCVQCGFLVNKEKSFFDSGTRFRESCGGDFLQGSYVRAFNLKAPPGDRKSNLEPWLYTILNAILPLYKSYFGSLKYVYSKDLLIFLFGLFKEFGLKVKPVPPYYPDDSGLKSLDWRRLQRVYRFETEPLHRSQHGTYRFKFCRFVYRESAERDDMLRYACWLHSPRRGTPRIISPRHRCDDARFLFPVRRRGGYVVAQGLSSCWSP